MKNLVRTILFFSWMWVLLGVSLFLLIPLVVLKLFLPDSVEKYTLTVSSAWARHLIWTSGSEVIVIGRENIPENGAFCIIANHNSNFDIPLLMSRIPRKLGFISKIEMAHVPFLSTWMNALDCIYIKRKSLESSISGLKKAIEKVKNGQSMVLFPEGTRSRGKGPGKFYTAGIRLALEAGIPLVPMTIKNSAEMFEATGKITPVRVEMHIHPTPKDCPDDIIRTILSPLSEKS